MNASSKLHKNGEHPTTNCPNQDPYLTNLSQSNSMPDPPSPSSDAHKRNSRKSINGASLNDLASDQPQSTYSPDSDNLNGDKFNSNGSPKPKDVEKDSALDTENLNKTKARHKIIVEQYHTKVCEENENFKCAQDFFKCFDSHEREYLRRKPLRKNNGWNYSSELCHSIEKTAYCANGTKCPFSHSNNEKIYHPTRFKRIICNFFAAGTNCPRGYFCFKAHGKNDFSTLSKNDFPIASNTDLIQADSAIVPSSPKAYYIPPAEFVKMTVYTATKNPEYYMFEYKTKPCMNAPCQNIRCCTNYHHEQERRRSPRDFVYSAEPCTAVKLPCMGNNQIKWREPSRCEKLVLCEFSHTLLEQMYHPHIYKTSLCSNYIENPNASSGKRQNCLWGNLCTHAHGKADLRKRCDQYKTFNYASYQKNGHIADHDEDGSENAKQLSSQSKKNTSSKSAEKHLKSGAKGKSGRGSDAARGKTNSFASQGLSFSDVLRGAGGDVGNSQKPKPPKSQKPDQHPPKQTVTVQSRQLPKNMAHPPSPSLYANNSPKPPATSKAAAGESNAAAAAENTAARGEDGDDGGEPQSTAGGEARGKRKNSFKGNDYSDNDRFGSPVASPRKPQNQRFLSPNPAPSAAKPPAALPPSPDTRPMNVKKYFSPVIGPDRTALFSEAPASEEDAAAFFRLDAAPAPAERALELPSFGRFGEFASGRFGGFEGEGAAGELRRPEAQQPLQIVQDSPMYALCGERRKESAESMVIDYRTLFENLQRRYVCPGCGGAGAARNRVFVPCGHFFCKSCAYNATPNRNLGLDSLASMPKGSKPPECPKCRSKCDALVKLLFE